MQAHLHPVMTSNPPPSFKSAPAPLLPSIPLENAVVVVTTKDCCMSYVVTRLFSSLGVNPRVVEVETDTQLVYNCNTPAVFIGGHLLGGVDRLLAAHISGSLVPQLKAAGALWL